MLCFSFFFVLIFPPRGAALIHRVEPEETLYALSLLYTVPINWILLANNLEGAIIYPGQTLEIPTEGISSFLVRPGDTLSELAWELGIDQDRLKHANGLLSDSLRVGQKLQIPALPSVDYYQVMLGDTLTSIAEKTGLSIPDLRRYNGLSHDLIKPEEKIRLVAPHPPTHRVIKGDSLGTIALRYKLNMEELRAWNNLSSDVIRLGDSIALYGDLSAEESLSPRHPQKNSPPPLMLASVNMEHSYPVDFGETSALPREGEYFFSAPKKNIQPDNRYGEMASQSTATDYRRSQKIWEVFQREIAPMGGVDDLLEGWHVIIDPGHGGLDPGAIATIPDGLGNPVVITEDEYTYDISLRLHRALRRHGAAVSLTLLAPDHHIRDGLDARHTFVHRKNEVYNQKEHNIRAAWRPVGNSEGLDLRKIIAAEQIAFRTEKKKNQGEKTLFISIHADNSPELPVGRALLFDGADKKEWEASLALATVMAQHMGEGSFTRRQALSVLRHNPADTAILIEVRNIHYARHAWALRSAELREQDALMITQGILAWASKN